MNYEPAAYCTESQTFFLDKIEEICGDRNEYVVDCEVTLGWNKSSGLELVHVEQARQDIGHRMPCRLPLERFVQESQRLQWLPQIVTGRSEKTGLCAVSTFR